MTSLERLRTAMSGGTPDRVPVSPFGWGHVDPDSDIGREMLARLDMLICVGPKADPFWGAAAEVTSQQEGDDTLIVYRTPLGDLRRVHRRTAITSATIHFPCRTAADLIKVRSVPYRMPEPDLSAYHAWVERAGEEALVLVGVSDAICWPATLFSPEDLCYAWADARDELIAITNLAHERTLAFTKRLCEMGVKAFRIIGGEYATTQLGPAGFRALCLNQDRELCALMQSYGAIAYYHNHGPVMPFAELFADVGMNALDPLEGPPYGDADLTEARRRLGDIAMVGNLDDMELVEQWPIEALQAEAARRLEAAGPRAFVLGGTASGTYTERGARGFLSLVEVAEAYRG